MLRLLALPCVTVFAMASSLRFAQSPLPNGVKTLNPSGAIKTNYGGNYGDSALIAL
jgi:hypothetical protein